MLCHLGANMNEEQITQYTARFTACSLPEVGDHNYVVMKL